MNKYALLGLTLCTALGCTQSDDTEPTAASAATMADAAVAQDSAIVVPTDGLIQTAEDMGLSSGADTGTTGSPDGGSPPPSEACFGLCEYLDMCGSCFFDPQGDCLDTDGCAEVCQAETDLAVAQCVADLAGCDETNFQGCYDANVGDDDCANTCRFLEDCGQCFADENGDCLSIASCAVVCRESTPPTAAACLAALAECDGIEACYD